MIGQLDILRVGDTDGHRARRYRPVATRLLGTRRHEVVPSPPVCVILNATTLTHLYVLPATPLALWTALRTPSRDSRRALKAWITHLHCTDCVPQDGASSLQASA